MNNAYTNAMLEARESCIYHITTGNRLEALVELELLYFLIGKNIRLDCLKRVEPK